MNFRRTNPVSSSKKHRISVRENPMSVGRSTPGENMDITIMRRSIVAEMDIIKGAKITKEMLLLLLKRGL